MNYQTFRGQTMPDQANERDTWVGGNMPRLFWGGRREPVAEGDAFARVQKQGALVYVRTTSDEAAAAGEPIDYRMLEPGKDCGLLG